MVEPRPQRCARRVRGKRRRRGRSPGLPLSHDRADARPRSRRRDDAASPMTHGCFPPRASSLVAALGFDGGGYAPPAWGWSSVVLFAVLAVLIARGVGRPSSGAGARRSAGRAGRVGGRLDPVVEPSVRVDPRRPAHGSLRRRRLALRPRTPGTGPARGGARGRSHCSLRRGSRASRTESASLSRSATRTAWRSSPCSAS